MRHCTTLLLAIAVVVAALAPLSARAQEAPPVSLEIQAGYDSDGQYRVGHWFPVTIVAANDGADLRGTLELRFPGESGGIFRYDLELPRGARKRVTLPVVTSESHGSAAISLQADGVELLRRPVRLDPLTTDQLVIGVLSSDPSLLNSLRAIRTNNGIAVAVAHLDPSSLPEDAALLGGLSALFIHDVATAELSDAQRAALALWVRGGGELIVSGGPSAERSTPGLAELLPVELGALQGNVPATSLARLARAAQAPAPEPLTASAVTLRAGATDLDGAGLISARDEGAGRVIFTAFDLAALRTWAGEAALWQALIRQEDRAQVGQSFRLRNENLLRDALQSDALRLPSIGLLLLLMVVYIVVIGPLNFLLLRRANRVELAWVTTPLLVAGFLAASYGASFALRGTSAQLTQLTVVQGFEGAPDAQATAFLGVFSPQRRSYELGFDPSALVTPGTFEGFQFRAAPVTSTDTATSVRDLLIDVSSLRTLMMEQPVALAPDVASSLTSDGSRVQGELRLEQGPALRDVQIVSGAASEQVGNLQPGATVQVDLNRTLQNFPDQVTLEASGSINRDRVLYSLFGYDRFAAGGPTFQAGKGMPEPNGVYLVGWADGALLGTQINGAPAAQQGETLYVIRLDVQQ